MSHNSWVKLRPQILLEKPEVLAIEEFLEARVPDYYGEIPDPVLRLAIVTALAKLWWRSRDQGGDPELLEGFKLEQLGRLSGLPLFGQAMESVGWAKEVEEGVRLPGSKRWLPPKQPSGARKRARRGHAGGTSAPHGAPTIGGTQGARERAPKRASHLLLSSSSDDERVSKKEGARMGHACPQGAPPEETASDVEEIDHFLRWELGLTDHKCTEVNCQGILNLIETAGITLPLVEEWKAWLNESHPGLKNPKSFCRHHLMRGHTPAEAGSQQKVEVDW